VRLNQESGIDFVHQLLPALYFLFLLFLFFCERKLTLEQRIPNVKVV